MFGYIRVSKGDLKVKEYEFYKAVYCTLCKTMGREYSLLSRFTLSYDFTFLALLNMSLKDGCDAVEKKHCVFKAGNKAFVLDYLFKVAETELEGLTACARK